MGSRKTSETRDLFNQPAPKARESFSIKNEIEETILNS
jgi:hypothetical protein